MCSSITFTNNDRISEQWVGRTIKKYSLASSKTRPWNDDYSKKLTSYTFTRSHVQSIALRYGAITKNELDKMDSVHAPKPVHSNEETFSVDNERRAEFGQEDNEPLEPRPTRGKFKRSLAQMAKDLEPSRHDSYFMKGDSDVPL